MKKKSFKRHLSEIFLKQNFAELSKEEKKKELKACLVSDLKWFLLATSFVLCIYLLIHFI